MVKKMIRTQTTKQSRQGRSRDIPLARQRDKTNDKSGFLSIKLRTRTIQRIL